MWRQARRFISNDIKTFKKTDDLIGPPCPRSLLRPVKLAIPPNETTIQWKHRLYRLEVHRWNEKFWTEHNDSFHRERKAYIAEKLRNNPEKLTVTTDKMSEFYKAFLDKNKRMHIEYNFNWYLKNIKLLYMSLEVVVEKFLIKIKLA